MKSCLVNLEVLDNKMYSLNRKLSALIYIQKLKTKEEAEAYLKRINQEIGNWIKDVRDIKDLIHEENDGVDKKSQIGDAKQKKEDLSWVY